VAVMSTGAVAQDSPKQVGSQGYRCGWLLKAAAAGVFFMQRITR
jgi:hypothetical protein